MKTTHHTHRTTSREHRLPPKGAIKRELFLLFFAAIAAFSTGAIAQRVPVRSARRAVCVCCNYVCLPLAGGSVGAIPFESGGKL